MIDWDNCTFLYRIFYRYERDEFDSSASPFSQKQIQELRDGDDYSYDKLVETIDQFFDNDWDDIKTVSFYVMNKDTAQKAVNFLNNMYTSANQVTIDLRKLRS